jgi:Trypsin-like peptidase domain
MEPQLTEFKRCFVRINTEDGIPVGAGFLISDDGHMLTCAHVVAAALRMRDGASEKPQGAVHLDFPFLGAAARTAQVERWLPPSGPSTNPSGDIAVLRLATTPPDGAQPARLTAERVSLGRKFQSHGYPKGYDAGVWAYGELRDRLGNGWLQVEDTKGTGRRIEQGFSGGPVQDQASDRIIGMVVASTREKSEKVGFVILFQRFDFGVYLL